MKINKQNVLIAFFCLILAIYTYSQNHVNDSLYSSSNYLIDRNWDSILHWETFHNDSSTIQLLPFSGYGGNGIQANYKLDTNYKSSAWVIMSYDSIKNFDKNTTPIVLLIKANANTDMELKFIDKDGSVFLKRYSINKIFNDWTQIVVYLKNTKYEWGGDSLFDEISKFEIAFSSDGTGSGTVWIDEIGVGKEGILQGFYLDPYRETADLGFYQRRSDNIIQEDTLVLEYLKVLQDFSSPDANLLPNQDPSDLVSTFNSSLAAMAFIKKGERERAEKILDFYAEAIDSTSTDSTDQSFFYKGEPRGFYQQININTYKRAGESEDRWIGDMAWLVIAYKHYEERYGNNSQYENVVKAISDLLISNYKVKGNDCGCIQTGWQNGDKLFDTTCHNEGNIGCYAALKVCGKLDTANLIKKWLIKNLVEDSQPLDHYTWRSLAFENSDDSLIMIPEFDFRYRKKLYTQIDSFFGIYSFPDINVNNTWTEGIGHMACTQYYCGNTERGNFYSNQFDPLLLQYVLHGRTIKTLPYAFNKKGEYSEIDTTIGAVSSTVWYIFAKNKFNPLCLPNITNIKKEICYGESYKIGDSELNEQRHYIVILENQYGCDSIVNLDLIINSLPTINPGSNSPVCKGDTLNLTETGGEAISWNWTGPNGFNSSEQNPSIPTATTVTSGQYRVSIIDSNGCQDDSLLDITINSLPTINLGKDTSINIKQSLSLDAGEGFQEYEWSINSTSNTLLVDSAFGIDTHIIWVKITDHNSCSNSDTILITIEHITGMVSINALPTIIKIYPNPTSGEVNLTIENILDKIVVNIISIDGHLIYSKELSPIEGTVIEKLGFNHQSKGIYLIRVINGKLVKTGKFILK